MVLLTRVTCLGRGSPSAESPQHSTKIGKKKDTKPSVLRQVPDPPAGYASDPPTTWALFSDIPHIVTVVVNSDDDISVLREPRVKTPKPTNRTLTPRPKIKSTFSPSGKCRSFRWVAPPTPPAGTFGGIDDWPSDEEGEMTTKGSRKALDSAAFDLCCIGNIFSPSPPRQTNEKRDDDTDNLSSSREKSLTYSASSCANSLDDDDLFNRPEERDPPAMSGPWQKYRLV